MRSHGKYGDGVRKWRCRDRARKYREANREKNNAYDRAYREANREKKNAYNDDYKQKRISNGLCARCGEPKLSEWYCWNCLNKMGVLGCRETVTTQDEMPDMLRAL